jgi:uncharacterized protein YgiB involved in biofilm formation
MRKESNELLLKAMNEKPDSLLIVYQAGDQIHVSWQTDRGIEQVLMFMKIAERQIDNHINATSKTTAYETKA